MQRLHGLHRFSTDNSFVKHHYSADCSVKAEGEIKSVAYATEILQIFTNKTNSQ